MTTPEHAAQIARIAAELRAAMLVFPKLTTRQQTNLAIAGDLIVERLHQAWAEFVAQQWREREPQ